MKLHCCALCDRAFGTPGVFHSREHIIPNSIGGQKKVLGIVCKDCNDRTGAEWDSVLAEQLGLVTVLANVKRERGEQPSFEARTQSGRPIRIHADGHLSLPRAAPKETIEDGHVKVTGTLPTIRDAVRLFEGLKRKYPKFDIQAASENLRVEKSYISEPVVGPIYIHGDASGRSIVKSTYVLAAHAGIDPRQCVPARNYLRGSDESACWWFYYDRDLIRVRPLSRIFHCVAVQGNPDTRQLVGYVEYFGAYRILVLLSSEFDGVGFVRSHAIDPATGRELDICPDLNIPAQDVIAACSGQHNNATAMFAAMNPVMGLVYQKRRQREFERAVLEAFLVAMKRLGLDPNQPPPAEHLPEIMRLFRDEMLPYLEHQANLFRPKGPSQTGA
jgi:hypothetical protein